MRVNTGTHAYVGHNSWYMLYAIRSDVDPCIFEGWLQNESNVYVTLTGGCPYEDSFEVNE
jgi:hypothetical protein